VQLQRDGGEEFFSALILVAMVNQNMGLGM
jgi:hypothetical protein